MVRKKGPVRTHEKKWEHGSSLMAQWVKDPALSLLGCRSDPWCGNFCMLWARPTHTHTHTKLVTFCLEQIHLRDDRRLISKIRRGQALF